jgi:hypothetical protein
MSATPECVFMSLRRASIIAALTLGLTIAATASAGSTGEETIRLNPADQATARSATLHRSDFKPTLRHAWLAVRVEQALSLPHCPGGADMSRFVITGVATRRWLGGTMEVDTQTNVMGQPWMLRGEWRSRAQGRGALECTRRAMSNAAKADGARLVRLQRMSVPRIAPFSSGLRAVEDLSALGFPARWLVETIAVGRGRTAIVVTVSGFVSEGQSIHEAVLGFAKLLVERVRA